MMRSGKKIHSFSELVDIRMEAIIVWANYLQTRRHWADGAAQYLDFIRFAKPMTVVNLPASIKEEVDLFYSEYEGFLV